jgi:tRNA (guanine-N7-)-methyltransferase
VSAAVTETQPLNVLNRPPLPHEFVPPDYFCRLAPDQLARPGRPLEVDLGCGDGSFLMAMGRQFPERDFLGVERLLGRVKKVCRKAWRQQLENVRVLRLESRYTVEWLLPAGAVSRLHLLCPDPWPKVRHHRRRLVQPEFLAAVRQSLAPGGEFLFMTDHEEYFRWAEERVAAFPGMERLEWEEDSFFYPKTDFQQLWESHGKTMWRLRCRRPLSDA